jgi:hypothetical protein
MCKCCGDDSCHGNCWSTVIKCLKKIFCFSWCCEEEREDEQALIQGLDKQNMEDRISYCDIVPGYKMRVTKYKLLDDTGEQVPYLAEEDAKFIPIIQCLDDDNLTENGYKENWKPSAEDI